MNDLPPGWAVASVESIAASLIDGPFGSNLKSEHYQPSGVRVIRLQNIADGRFDDRDKAYVSLAHANSLNRHEARPGDVLIAALGDVLPRVCLVPPDIDRAIVKADCFRLRPHKGISAKYLSYILSAPQMRKRASTEIAGVGRPRLNLAKVSALTIPVPPSAEQERIVAAIEEQFSRLDAGVAALERVRLNLKRMRGQGVSSLFEPLWPRVPLTDVLTLISDCPHRTPTYTDGEGYPALRPRDVVGGELRLETCARVSAQEYRLQTARHTPEAGDIVYSRELSYGWAVELPEKPLVCLSQGMVILRTTELLPGFLTLFLNSHEGRQQADRAATGTAHPHINLRDIKQYKVPLASHTDQRKVLALASDLLSECDRASQSVAAAMIRAAALRSAVLSYAFSGKLIPQNPKDGPASALLEGIIAERASSNGKTSPRTRKIRVLREDIDA
jgi:type I restriction enzyme, S subunit